MEVFKSSGTFFGNADIYYRRISYVTFLFNNYHCTISKSKLLNGTETSFRCALISNNSVSLVLKRGLWVGTKNRDGAKERGDGYYVCFHFYANP